MAYHRWKVPSVVQPTLLLVRRTNIRVNTSFARIRRGDWFHRRPWMMERGWVLQVRLTGYRMFGYRTGSTIRSTLQASLDGLNDATALPTVIQNKW